MMKDPVVDEIRKVRKSIDKMIDKNPAKFHAEIESILERYKHRVVRLEPRYIKKTAA